MKTSTIDFYDSSTEIASFEVSQKLYRILEKFHPWEKTIRIDLH